MEFVKCKMKDFEAVSALYTRVVNHLENTVNYPKWSENHPSAESIEGAIERGELFACFENGKPVGAAAISDDPEGAYEAGEWKNELRYGEFLVIHMLAVDPEKSGMGTGGFLVRKLLSLAGRLGYKAVRLDVVPGNIPALRLYQREGFTYAGTKDLRRGIAEIPEFDLFEYNF